MSIDGKNEGALKEPKVTVSPSGSVSPPRNVGEDTTDQDAMEDFRRSAGQIQNFKERLISIGQAGKEGKMNSYGLNKESTLKRIVSMRKAQVEIFRKHMGLELNLSEKVDTDSEINSKEFSEKFQEEFKAKESELKSITTMLDNLSKVMIAVNDDTKSALLPTEPGVQQIETKPNVLKNLHRNRNQNQNINTEKQAAWRNKLHLAASTENNGRT